MSVRHGICRKYLVTLQFPGDAWVAFCHNAPATVELKFLHQFWDRPAHLEEVDSFAMGFYILRHGSRFSGASARATSHVFCPAFQKKPLHTLRPSRVVDETARLIPIPRHTLLCNCVHDHVLNDLDKDWITLSGHNQFYLPLRWLGVSPRWHSTEADRNLREYVPVGKDIEIGIKAAVDKEYKKTTNVNSLHQVAKFAVHLEDSFVSVFLNECV